MFCGMYTDIARTCELVFDCRRAAARYGWRVCGILMGSMLVYVVLLMARRMQLMHAFFSYQGGCIPICSYKGYGARWI